MDVYVFRRRIQYANDTFYAVKELCAILMRKRKCHDIHAVRTIRHINVYSVNGVIHIRYARVDNSF